MVDNREDEESYFDQPHERQSEGFDAELLREPLTALPVQRAITLSPNATVTEAITATRTTLTEATTRTEASTDMSATRETPPTSALEALERASAHARRPVSWLAWWRGAIPQRCPTRGGHRCTI